MKPDFDKLTTVHAEMRQLQADGKLTRKRYDELLADAELAVDGYEPALEGVLRLGLELGFVTAD